ncbi:CHAT domain-containing protein [Streptomyces flaveus]|uniref:CHAT domain-containing protein n=1 Tax=Streptomyces flaveus TaxID=66370 RepID=UPI00332BAD93
METLDFYAEIGAGSMPGDSDPCLPQMYEITLRGPDGAEASVVRPFPLPPAELRILDTTIPHAVLSSSAQVRRSVTDDELPVRELGRRLFDFLMAGDGHALFAAARHQAALNERRLRIVLRVRPPELARLPWEFLFDKGEDSYVCPTTPLVRHPQVGSPQRPLLVQPPLRVLCMVARPDDREPLAVRAEQEWLVGALSGLADQGLIELAWTKGQTWRDLRAALRGPGGPWHAFHFIGHGGFDTTGQEGTLALADETGGTYQLGAEDLAMILSGYPSLRLVVLNACETGRSADRDPFSSAAGALMRKGVPAVVAMQYPISNRAAVEFSRAFYESLAHRRPVDEAVMEARQAIRLAQRRTLEWGTPVLYMRALDGHLFDIGETPGPEAAADDLNALYVAGLASFYKDRWDRAVEVFREVMARDPGYEDVQAKFAKSVRMRRFHHLYEAGLGAVAAQQWDAAVDHLEAVVASEPDFLDARSRLEDVRRRRTAAGLRAEAADLHAAGEWEAVVAVGTRLAELMPEEPDPDGVVADARARLVNARAAGAPSPSPGEDPGAKTGSGVETEPGAETGLSVEPDRGVETEPWVEPGPWAELSYEAMLEYFGMETDSPGGADEAGPSPVRPRVGRPAAVHFDGEPSGRSLGSESPEPEGEESAWIGREDFGPLSRQLRLRESDSSTRGLRIPTPRTPRAFAFSPDGTRLAIGCEGRYAVVADIEGGNRQQLRHAGMFRRTGAVWSKHANWVSVALSPGGDRIVTHGYPTLRVWDVTTGRQVAEWRTEHAGNGLALGAAGGHVLFGETTGTYIWDVQADAVRRLEAQTAPVGTVVASPDGTRFATLDVDQMTLAWTTGRQLPTFIRIWDAATGRLLFERYFQYQPHGLALSPDNSRFATQYLDRVLLCSTDGSEEAQLFQGQRVEQLAYNHDGSRLVIATDRHVGVTDLSTGDLLYNRRYEEGWQVRAVCFGPDGHARALVTHGADVWLTHIDKRAEGYDSYGGATS